tara:strand:- start:394 stop:651 length:258 start_codon:yes stop_codon:yes gene_type:complete
MEIKPNHPAPTGPSVYNFMTYDGLMDVELKHYRAVCTVTKQPNQFHHAYLANMIKKRFDNNFDTFVQTYVSRAGQKALQSKAETA